MTEPTTTIRLPKRLRVDIAGYAKAAHKSQSAVIIEALQEYLTRRNRQHHIQTINKELQRLDEIERQDPDLCEFYTREQNPWTSE